MSTISNRFFVSVIDDGSTLHGELRAVGSLTQAWNGSTAIPQWNKTEIVQDGVAYVNSPIIYLSLLNGATVTSTQSAYDKWEYNGKTLSVNAGTEAQVIKFKRGEGAEAHVDTYHGRPCTDDSRFWILTDYKIDGSTVVPALAIVGNLADADNPDVDSITFIGAYSVGTSTIDFSCTINVRISRITGTGYFGQVNFVGGTSDITAKGQVLTAYAALYDQNGDPLDYQNFKTVYDLNADDSGDGITPTEGTDITVGGVTYHQAYQIREADVTDYSILETQFFYPKTGSSSKVVYTSYDGIDDRQDPEYLYIVRDSESGNSASLRNTDNPVTFMFYVGLNTDNTPQAGWTYKTKLIDEEGTVMMGDYSAYDGSIQSADSTGFRNLKYVENTSNKKAYLTIPYSFVKNEAKNHLSGIIYAQHS